MTEKDKDTGAFLQETNSWEWCHMPVIPAHRRQDDQEFKAILSHI